MVKYAEKHGKRPPVSITTLMSPTFAIGEKKLVLTAMPTTIEIATEDESVPEDIESVT